MAPAGADPAIRLLESPESVFVVCDDGVPRTVTWRGRRLTIERAVGPERLSGDWWDDGYRRDYWRCESAFGDFVLYLDRMDDQWWVQGWFD
jgi:protein ImuB